MIAEQTVINIMTANNRTFVTISFFVSCHVPVCVVLR